MKLILASASPRRQDLLRRAGYAFDVQPADVDEEQQSGRLLPADLALHLARLKASVVAPRFPEDVTLAADTVVAFGDSPVGKPADEAAAAAMIALLEGTTHIVLTGVVVQSPARKLELGCVAMSAVRMKRLTPAEIDRYVRSGRWRGKAGGYGIQDPSPLVGCVGGSPTNVVGLPMQQTRQMLAQAGITPGPASPAANSGGEDSESV